MVAERAGYTVTMFLVDISPTMGKTRTVQLPDGPGGEPRSTEMTNLEWALQFIFNGRKTDQCGVIVFGSEDTDNVINEKNGGYEHVSEYIPIGQPNANTLAQLSALEPSEITGDPIDALIVGVETQHRYLSSKKTWTRKMILVTDGENPIEIEDWEAIVKKMNAFDVRLTIIGVDFDDEELPFHEEDKSQIKHANETFFHTFTSSLTTGLVGNCALALIETTRPDIKTTKSALMGTTLRMGDPETRDEEAVVICVKASKATAMARPKGWKRFALRSRVNEEGEGDRMDVDEEEGGGEKKEVFAQLKMRTEYVIDTHEAEDDEGASDDKVKVEDPDEEDDSQEEKKRAEHLEKVEKEQLQRGFKYGQTYVLCPDGFERLRTRKGIDICGFFLAKNFRRELPMSEVSYIWADPSSPSEQVALSSIVQAMYEKGVMAIARWVSRDGMDPKMGVLHPVVFDKVDCLLWVQMPFADDIRKYSFASLDNLINKNGEPITKHPYIPTEEQQEAMDNFVDAMDLMYAGEKDEEGNRGPWFDPRLSYNPAIHRTKQALFHSAVVSDLTTNPLPPPHPELLKYFEPPKKVVKRARGAVEECKTLFKVKEVPKRVIRPRKDGHVRARDEDEDMLLLDNMPRTTPSPQKNQPLASTSSQQLTPSKKKPVVQDSDTETEDEDESNLLLDKKGPPRTRTRPDFLPTPAPDSPSSSSQQLQRLSISDRGRAPGRIVGTTYPLEDFRQNIKEGDLVTKAVEDLGFVIGEIVMKPFTERRTGELLDCLKEMRDVSLKEDEIDAWNDFLQELKDNCLSDPGNPDFWNEVTKLGRSISLISKPEAAKHGGKSSISENLATKFIES
ncbi:hypothetical protein JAAARDRAFT_196318 [Jaapia argillacea MUCL 33604]|uniref:ATP-dependent DNA helicase II subunit 2 n=1 Tax=Jaapia argillacea MUCL 33604 TaxID=933084 RepID=A0A067PUL0_9AGAM|nr:hypothetical protein JAAARDRAFT_196318 [Jaapia argillacea MUCL 33604]